MFSSAIKRGSGEIFEQPPPQEGGGPRRGARSPRALRRGEAAH